MLALKVGPEFCWPTLRQKVHVLSIEFLRGIFSHKAGHLKKQNWGVNFEKRVYGYQKDGSRRTRDYVASEALSLSRRSLVIPPLQILILYVAIIHSLWKSILRFQG